MRCELGGVDHYRYAPAVGGGDDRVDRRKPSGDVRGTGDGHEGRAGTFVEGRLNVLEGEGTLGSALHMTARGDPGPWQQVGVVLDHGSHDHIGGSQAQAVGEMVERL